MKINTDNIDHTATPKDDDDDDYSPLEVMENEGYRLKWLSESLRENGAIYVHQGESDIFGVQMLSLSDELSRTAHHLLAVTRTPSDDAELDWLRD